MSSHTVPQMPATILGPPSSAAGPAQPRPVTVASHRMSRPATGSAPGGGPGKPAVVVTPPMDEHAVEAWERMRRGVDTARSLTGRVATLSGGVAALAVVAAPVPLTAVVTVGATVVAVAVGTGILRLQMPFRGHQKSAATVLYTVPGIGLAGVLLTEWATAHVAWGGTRPLQVLLAGAWTLGVWLLRPARAARRMVSPPPPPARPRGRARSGVVVDQHPVAQWWAEHVAAHDGPAAGTALAEVQPIGQEGLTAIIRATTPGKPVPDISIRHLSALLDVPEAHIHIDPVFGRGAGVRRFTVGQGDVVEADADPTTVWANTIAPLAMPGAVVTAIRVGSPAPVPAGTASPLPAPDSQDTDSEDQS